MTDQADQSRALTDQAAIPRRKFIQALGGGLLVAGLPKAALSQPLPWSHHGANALEKARAQGLVVWHGDQEEDVVKFLGKFVEATGIPTKQFRLLPGAALPRLQAELRMNRSDADVYLCADPGLMDQLRVQGHLMKYDSPELAAYNSQFKSSPEGYWATYYLYFGPMMYSPRYVEEGTAPRTWLDLLDPRWAGQIGFQNSSAGSQYGWWYVLKDVLPKDYWVKLANQKPRAYASSTQIVNDIHSGKLKIGGKVNAFQYVKAVRQGLPAKAVFPPEGTPAGNAAVGVIAATKRPEAAMIFMDYFLSREGQFAFNDIQGSPSARPDVVIRDVPAMSDIKIVLPQDFADYQSSARHAEFVALWNKMMGV
jgi:iron(III) transport system substrate-binding protein